MLHLKNINVYYGKMLALESFDMHIKSGSIVSLIGSNGAGKSTVLKVISRLINIREGEYLLENKSVQRKNASEIVKNGVIHCPENRRVFPEFTVQENLNIGAYLLKSKKDAKKNMEKVYDLFPRLKDRKIQLAGTLSGGEQQMLAIGRSLMANPKLLLLDEPSLGLAPTIIEEIFETIKEINDRGTTILLVEQNAYLSLKISDYTYILENGKIVTKGKSKKIKNNEKLAELYLGI